jgi:carbon-monoxide dehydrogenase large subunit
MERLIDAAARATGMDRIALRRRNLISEREMPYATAVGTVYDSGAFEAVLDAALAASRYDSFAERRAGSLARGKLRGLGISCFLEHAGGRGAETADLAFAGGKLILGLGTQSTGQGHATVFGEVLSGRLGIPAEAVRVVQGDSDLDLAGGPSVGSRTAMSVGAALAAGADALVVKGRRAAAILLEAAEEDIRYAAGRFEVAGTDRRIGLFDLAEQAAGMAARGENAESLDTRSVLEVPASFPNGCHVAEVEIDPETGHVDVVGYVAVDDCGTVLDHTLAEGQVVGGLAQGLGQALLEAVVYDPDTGQLVTGTFNDYAMPRADRMPPVASLFHPVPCRTNPLGVKGVGEAGTTAAIAAVMNAIADAVPNGRGADLDMPATPEKVWRACSS